MRQLLLVLLVLCVPHATAADDELEEVLVSGEHPGPGLWQVSHGENTVWILGTYSPLPEGMKWRSRTLEGIVSRSQAVIAPASVTTNIGMFSGLRLVPALLRARAIPDGRKLQEVLPPELYARWSPLKAQYLKGHDKVERWRPAFAAGELYEQALRRARLRERETAWPEVERFAKRHDVPIRRPEVQLQIENPRGLIQDFSRASLDADIVCFESLLSRVENEMPLLKERARAWATGDVETLRRLREGSPESSCLGVITSTPRLAAEYEAALRRVRQEWLLAVEGALLRNATTVAVVPIRELLSPDGLLARLRSLGYRIDEP